MTIKPPSDSSGSSQPTPLTSQHSLGPSSSSDTKVTLSASSALSSASAPPGPLSSRTISSAQNETDPYERCVDNFIDQLHACGCDEDASQLKESIIEGHILYITLKSVTKLPDSIGDLIHLTELHIIGTQITSLPTSIGNLNELESLALIYNPITSLPTSIGNLQNLHALDLATTNLKTLPREILNIPKLGYLTFPGGVTIIDQTIGRPGEKVSYGTIMQVREFFNEIRKTCGNDSMEP